MSQTIPQFKKIATMQNKMKKVITIFCAMFIASVILTSCSSNNIESDAKKYAELMCRAQKLLTEGTKAAAAGDMSAIAEATKLSLEAASFAKEMEGKYVDAADFQKFTKAYLKAMDDCK